MRNGVAAAAAAAAVTVAVATVVTKSARAAKRPRQAKNLGTATFFLGVLFYDRPQLHPACRENE